MELSALELVRHAAGGAAVAGGGLTLAQSLLARRLRRPSSLAVALGGFVGTSLHLLFLHLSPFMLPNKDPCMD